MPPRCHPQGRRRAIIAPIAAHPKAIPQLSQAAPFPEHIDLSPAIPTLLTTCDGIYSDSQPLNFTYQPDFRRLKKVRFLLMPFAAIVFVYSVFSPAHAQALRPNPPSAHERDAAIQSLPAPARLAMDAAEEQTTPVFIFIPGILGSKLSRKVDGKDVPFWGTARDFILNDPAFRYDEADAVSAEVLDDVYVPIIGEKLDVYGQGYQAITLITGSPESVLKFPYDWRQSNVRTADDLSKWLCKPDVQSVVKTGPWFLSLIAWAV
jgi:hypothetical protein